MSVTFYLYKPIDLKCKPSLYEQMKKEEYEKLIKEIDEKYSEDELEVKYNEVFNRKWPDNKEHSVIEFFKTSELNKKCGRQWKRKRRKLEKFKHFYIPTSHGITYQAIAADLIAYRQGWFLKKRFFKKPLTEIICTTKSEMETFFKKYVDYKGEDKRGREFVETFRSAWKDGMIFVCSW